MYKPIPPERDDAVKCPVSKRWIKEGQPGRWCEEIKKWIHPIGEQMIMDAFEKNELDKNPLYRIIYTDWESQNYNHLYD